MVDSAQSLKRRISTQLTRIIRGYVILISVLLALLTLLLGYYFKLNQLTHQRELVSTKVSTEVANVAHEMQSLSTSTLVWTGLTDSFGRDSYLQPLLSRFNRDKLRQFLILDYRGRVFLAPDPVLAEEIMADPVVMDAVNRGGEGYGSRPSADGLPTFVLVHRVLSPQSEAPVGFVVGTIDAGALVRELGLGEVNLALSIGGAPPLPALEQGLLLREEFRDTISPGDLNIAFQVLLAHDILSSLALGALVVLLAFLLGLVTLKRVAAWAQQFSAGTTERLDHLVLYCQKVLAGESVLVTPSGPADEISQVVDTLSAMLRQQRQTTDELRMTSVVFSTAAEGILITDSGGRIVEVNPALLRMTGFEREELIGRWAGSLYRLPGQEDAAPEILRALDSQGRWSGETSVQDRDGRLIPTSMSVSRIAGEDGQSVGHVAVITDVSRLKEAENKLRELAYRDSLTRLPNLRMMSQQVRQRLSASKRPFALLFVDLDHLKTVNDTYGHEAGDWMIRGMAEHLQRQLPPGHLLCRRSGDEFIALVDIEQEQPRSLWDAMLQRLTSASVELPAGEMAVSATIGVACYPQDAQSWHDLQICADVAMNAAKQAQRGTVAWYDNHLGQQVLRQRQVRHKLTQAIEQEVIRVHYQPVVDLASGRLIGFEALARWTDPELGEIRPSEFIPLAEDAQLSDQLTLQLLGTILRDKPRILQRFPGTVLAFNAAPRAFRDAKLINYLADQAAEAPELLQGLEVELTESVIASSESRLLRQLQVLTGMGVRLVIDDFGTGYSSLTRLAQYPISCLKIDASFVASLGLGRQTRIVELILNLAHLLDLKVTAEGIENQEQRETLLRMGCTQGQGWLFSKALPLEDLLQLTSPLAGLAPVPAQA